MSSIPSNLTIIFGADILESNAQVIAQQCNCTSKKAKGLSRSIVEKFPYADVYSEREKPSTPGTIKITGNRKKGERFVAALFAQLNPGKPQKGDSVSQRIEWFEQCLEKLARTKSLKSVAFPYNIGCGLAGGNWNTYYDILTKWTECHPNISVQIINRDSKPEELHTVECMHVDESSTCNVDDIIEQQFSPPPPSECTVASSVLPVFQGENSHPNELEFYRFLWSQLLEMGEMLNLKYFVQKYEQTSGRICHMHNDFFPSDTPTEVPMPNDEQHISSKFSELESPKEIDIIEDFEEAENQQSESPEEIDIIEDDDINQNDEDESDIEDEDQQSESSAIVWGDMSLKEYVESASPEGYEKFFDELIENEGLDDISAFLDKEISDGNVIYPPLEEVFTAFDLCPPDVMKVVIIGQDPYHSPGAAMGVAFGHHSDRNKVQPSLLNVYKALEKDGFSADRTSGDLTRWCEQGVFLINTALTVREGDAGSHAAKSKTQEGPWDYFIGRLFSYLSENCEHLVIIAWGAKAQAYTKYFSSEKHAIITAPHPAAAVYNPSNTEFFDHKPFSRANKQLKKWNLDTIDWDLGEE